MNKGNHSNVRPVVDRHGVILVGLVGNMAAQLLIVHD